MAPLLPLLLDHFDRGVTHLRLGPAIAIVSPFALEIVIVDPTAAQETMTKWKEWQKPIGIYTIFEVFGPNSNSTNGRDRMRHRKIGAVAFREGNCHLIWAEGRRQVGLMIGGFGTDKNAGVEVDVKRVAGGE
ncbi:hypothetical protein CAC42_6957 [Sphaceloma murrayae]|uniref:Uncharacterized protein n=1 Tax=Sphaceloma murrayae TaxID=2082308 RepID=A0A2K1QQC1_9PEZI|nr:hypothetical protein CAC42_6957 [Sphaceloma murrayae]